jgi:Uma2 family endonuclease
MAVAEISTKRWTTDEYYRIAELGLLDAGRSELIEGEIFMMSPQGGRHAQVVSRLRRALQLAFGLENDVRVQSPLRLSEASEPEPDISVIAGDPRDQTELPTTALLVAEVSDTSLSYDRERKELLYARASIPEYWLVNLKANEVEVRRQPSASGYLDIQTLTTSERIAPLALPNVEIAIGSFLP